MKAKKKKDEQANNNVVANTNFSNVNNTLSQKANNVNEINNQSEFIPLFNVNQNAENVMVIEEDEIKGNEVVDKNKENLNEKNSLETK